MDPVSPQKEIPMSASSKKQKRQKPKIPKPPFSFLKLTIFLFGLTLIGGAATAYFYLSTSRTVEGASLIIDGPDEVLLGVPFEVRLNIANESPSALSGARIELFLPDGIQAIGALDQAIIAKELENLDAGAVTQETFQLVPLKGEKSTKELRGLFSYATAGVTSRFVQEARFVINVGEAALRLDVMSPNKVLSGEEFSLEFSFRNISSQVFRDVTLTLDYPTNYEFLSSDKKAAGENNVWKFELVSNQETNKIAIVGRAYGNEGTFFNVGARLEIAAWNKTVVIDRRSASFAIAPSPIYVNIAANGKNDYVTRLSDAIRYEIAYENNTGVALADVIIKAQLSGELFNLKTVKSKAFFESINNTLTWNGANTPGLRSLPADAGGVVYFDINTKDAYPTRRLNDKNYALKLKVIVESPTVPSLVAAEKTVAVAEAENKVAGRVEIDAKALFRDAASGILNKGPMPMKVNAPTEFTVHWIIKTHGADMRNVEVRTALEAGVEWTGTVKSNTANTVPKYDERTSEVTWRIDKLHANRGVVDEAAEAIFQVRTTPSILNIGGYVPLVKETRLIATDEFTGARPESYDIGLGSDVPDDPTVTEYERVVIE